MFSESSSFRIFPAIDLLDGQSVRLQKGKRHSAHVVHPNALQQLQGYVAAGVCCVHLVNLNAAFDDLPSHRGYCESNKVLQALLEERKALGLEKKLLVQVGGGIRNRQAAERLFAWGVDRVVVGTWAVRKPKEVCELATEFKGQVIVGLDAEYGKLAAQGWTEVSRDLNLFQFARDLKQCGVGEVLYTQIENDGMLSGVDETAMLGLARESGLRVLASGGVATIADIQKLAACAGQGVAGVIVGKALHAGTLRLEEALRYQV